MAHKDPTPNDPSRAYSTMSPRWNVMNTILEGTESMREAGNEFLPAHIAETEDRYQKRLSSAILRNMTEDTLDSLCGKPFSEPVKRNEDIPVDIVGYLNDVDSQGNNIDSFCKKWFRSSVAKSFCHVLVEFPKVEPKLDGTPRTLADDRNEGLRPYLCRIEPENLISMRTEIIAGRESITHARIRRIVSVPTSRWSTAEVVEIMVLEAGTVELYRQEDQNKDDSAWVLFDSWFTGISFVPLVTFYTDKTSTMIGKPALLDLAYVNIAHWQSASDQRTILSVARLPILAVAGMSEEEAENVVIGPFSLLYTRDPTSKFYYVEHNGNAIEAGAKDLASLEEWMASYGAEFLKRKSGGQTATARALDSAESMSKLQAWTIDFEDKVATVLGYMKAWLTSSTEFEGGTIELVSDFNIGEASSTSLDALNKARDRKDISRKAYLLELKRRDILVETHDDEEDLIEIEAEREQELEAMMTLGGTVKNMDNNPDEEDDDEEEDLE